MARMRTVKPSLRTSRVVATWPFAVRYFWVLLWGYLDDKGRALDVPKTIAGDCFPHDDKVTPAVVGKWLTLMATTKLEPTHDPPLCRYEIGSTHYLHSVYWDEHQRPNRPTGSVHPPCPVHEGLTESVTEPPLSPHVLYLEGLKGREVEGAAGESGSEPPDPTPLGPEPSRRCRDHRDDPDPPSCRRCRDQRQRHEAWLGAGRARLAEAPRCQQPHHDAELASNCRLCASERKGAT
jgi:hypothetical protein